MNIAILIGVSNYKVANPLPACASDVAQMRRLLAATNKYDEILCLTKNTDSGSLKDAMRSFFAKYQSQSDIDEALVYFSGHGIFHTDALFCCSDFDSNRPATTSISNEEIDDLLRSVSPDVAVKIIDACQSGSPYIKDATAGFEKALKGSRLNSFMCMASSRQDQSSYASADASIFTSKWIEAALSKNEGIILYRDIQAALADSFVDSPEQTPFFVTQGTGLEPFTSVTLEMSRLKDEFSKISTETSTSDKALELIEAEVARMDTMYVSADEASKAIEEAGSLLEETQLKEPIVIKFYDKQVTLGAKLSNLPQCRAVADFAVEQGWNKKYFVKIIQEQYKARVPKDPFHAVSLGLAIGRRKLGDDDYVVENRTRPCSLEATQSLPIEIMEIHFEPRQHPSLKSFVSYIGIVHSLTAVVVLSAVVRLSEKGWTERKAELSEIQWKYQNYLWKDVVSDSALIWKEALALGEETIKTYLESLLPKKEESQETTSTANGESESATSDT